MIAPYYDRDGITIYHGDCLWVDAWARADVLVTDPPYGIAFESGWTGSTIKGDADTRARDSALSVWGDGRAAIVFGAAGEPRLPRSVATLVWHRPGSGMGDLSLPWKPDYEMIHVFGVGFHAAKRGPSVLSVPWDVFRGDALHPHQKPERLIRDLLARCPPGVVADPFMGSGTTLVAAKIEGRQAIGIEIEERYCEIAARRLDQGVLALKEPDGTLRERVEKAIGGMT